MNSALNRRDFLHQSSCLLAGTAAAGMLGRSTFAAEKSIKLTLACGDVTLRHVKEVDCWCSGSRVCRFTAVAK